MTEKQAEKQAEKKDEKKDKKDKKDDKKEKKDCANPENISITKCIRRELILNCPDWTKTADCDNLMAFAKSCPKYPPSGECGKKGEEKKGNKGEAKKKE